MTKLLEEGVIEQELYKGHVKVRFLGPTPDKPSRHMYYVDGKRVSGVTTIIGVKDKSMALIPWALEEAAKHLLPFVDKKLDAQELVTACFASEQSKNRAADIGTETHAWCEGYINAQLGKGEVPEMPENKAVQIGVNAFLDWEAAHQVVFHSSERLIFSKKHCYVGTMDIEATVDGKLCLIDLKTSNGLYNTVRMQTAAYVKADEEESGKVYQGRWAIRLAKETEAEYLERLAEKNKIKALLGKKEKMAEAYLPFEAKFLDDTMMDIEEDFKAFLACQTLMTWDRNTDFYYQKNK